MEWGGINQEYVYNNLDFGDSVIGMAFVIITSSVPYMMNQERSPHILYVAMGTVIFTDCDRQ